MPPKGRGANGAQAKSRFAPYIPSELNRQLTEAVKIGRLKKSAIADEALFEFLSRTRDYGLVLRRLGAVLRESERIKSHQAMHAEVFSQWLQLWLTQMPEVSDTERRSRKERAERVFAQILSKVTTAQEHLVSEETFAQQATDGNASRRRKVAQAASAKLRVVFHIDPELRLQLIEYAGSQRSESCVFSQALREYLQRRSSCSELIEGLNTVNRQLRALRQDCLNGSKVFNEFIKLWLRTAELQAGADPLSHAHRAEVAHKNLLDAAALSLQQGKGVLNQVASTPR